MSFEKYDPRLTAYVLDEADPDDRSAIDEAVRFDPELRAAMNDLSRASQTVVDALGAEALDGDTLDAVQTIRIEARAKRIAPRRRAWMRRRFVYGSLAAAATLLVCTLLLKEYVDRNGAAWFSPSAHWSPGSHEEAIEMAGAMMKAQGAQLGEPTQTQKQSAKTYASERSTRRYVEGPKLLNEGAQASADPQEGEAPSQLTNVWKAEVPDDALVAPGYGPDPSSVSAPPSENQDRQAPDAGLSQLDEFSVATGGTSASKRRDGFTRETERLEEQVGKQADKADADTSGQFGAPQDANSNGIAEPGLNEQLHDLYLDRGYSASGGMGSGKSGGGGLFKRAKEEEIGQGIELRKNLPADSVDGPSGKGNLQNVRVGGSLHVREHKTATPAQVSESPSEMGLQTNLDAKGKLAGLDKPGAMGAANGVAAPAFGATPQDYFFDRGDSASGGLGGVGTPGLGTPPGTAEIRIKFEAGDLSVPEARAAMTDALQRDQLNKVSDDGRPNIVTLYADVNGEGVIEKIPAYAEPDSDNYFRYQWGMHGGGVTAEQYAPIVENAFIQVSQQPLSTFGLDVDTASYANARRFLNSGQLPPPNAVRIEEFVNAFSYTYPAPADGRPVAVQADVAGCPWNTEHRLARIAVKAKDVPFEAQPPVRLTFLIDVSGSMQDNNKLPLLREAMKALTRKLRPADQIAIVTYNSTAQRVLAPTACSSADTICATIDSLRADGSTNGAGGIEVAYATATEQFLEGGLNRVILATDGDFNVGETENAALVQRIQEHAKSGVFLTVLGFGIDNLKDDRLEGLADKGNGNYYYIDSFAEANRVLVDRVAGTIAAVAKDVKIQVEFNPAKVGSYRLLGYENRALAAQDFNDDRKDAGDLGAGHTVTALYELVPAGVPGDAPGVDALKYQSKAAPSLVDNPESMTVKLRYKLPTADESDRIELPVMDGGQRFDEASSDFRFASAVAAFGMLLRSSAYSGSGSLNMVQQIAHSASGSAPDRAEFMSLVVSAKTLRGEVDAAVLDRGAEVVLESIVKWKDGTYRAELRTNAGGQSKRYKEGEVFDDYKVLSIDPLNRNVLLYKEKEDRELVLRLR